MSVRHDLLHDMDDAMRHADDPLPIIIDPIAIRGAVTVLVGKHSSMKSWLMTFGCAVAHRGGGWVGGAGGLRVAAASALYIDGEMGARIMARRWRVAGLRSDAFHVADGFRLRLPQHQEQIAELVDVTGAKLVVIDSLRRLAPGVREDKSDDMSPVMASLAELSRALDVAVVLIHHRSTKINSAEVRGSSAIEDQADLVLALEHVDGDPEPDRRRLRTVKYRLAEDPTPVWLRLGMVGGAFAAGVAEPYDRDAAVSEASRSRSIALADEADRIAGEVPALAGWPMYRLRERLGVDRSGTWDRVVIELRRRGWRLTGEGAARRIHPPPEPHHTTEPLGETWCGAVNGEVPDDVLEAVEQARAKMDGAA